MEVQLSLAAVQIVGAISGIRRRQRESRGWSQRRRRAGRALRESLVGIPGEVVVLLVAGEARADNESNQIREAILQLAEGGVRLGDEFIRGLGVGNSSVRTRYTTGGPERLEITVRPRTGNVA